MGEKKTSEAQIRAAVKHNQSKGSITIRPTKAEDARIRDAARRAGVGVTAYILDTLRARMDSDGVPPAADQAEEQ